jgi:hypothetical protein
MRAGELAGKPSARTTRFSLVLAGICVAVAGSGCGSAVERPAPARLSVGAASHIPGFVACMRKNGMTVAGDGELRIPKTVTPAELDAAERTCGFGTATTGERTRRAAESKAEMELEASARKTRAGRRLLKQFSECMREQGIDLQPGEVTAKSLSAVAVRSARGAAAVARCRARSIGR